MANWSTLKAAIANVIKTNGNQEITGVILQNTLNSIVNAVGENATFAGIATPSTNPGSPDGPVFYIASTAGGYSNFGGISLAANEISILEYTDSGTWVKKNTGFASKSFVDSAIHTSLRYTYWNPSSAPVLKSVSDAVQTVSYAHLVIVDVLTGAVYHNFKNGVTLDIDTKGIVLVYAKIAAGNTIELHYSYISEPTNSTHTDDYEAITDISKVIPLAIVESKALEDILKINSRSQFTMVPSVGTDITNLSNQIKDTIKYAKQLNAIIEINEDNKVFGNDNPDAKLNLVFPIAVHVDFSATTTNSEAESNGFLTEITAVVNSAGTYKFKVGLLDQYPRFVPSYEFTLNLANGRNVIDVSSMNIPIAKGEQLAISCTSTAGTSGTSSIRFKQNSEAIEHELFYGLNNGTWAKLATTYGGEIVLSYKMKTLETIFALKSQIEQLNGQIEKQNDTINSLKYVYDENGTPYKIAVINGQLAIKAVQYKNVLALGNSLTSHSYAPSIGYYGDSEWAMASTNKTITTWTNHLQTILKQKQPGAIVTPFNIAAWETDYMGADLNTLFATQIGIEYDLIIIRAGENGIAGDDYAQGVDRLVTFLRANFSTADIVITDMFWHNATKEAVFREIAEKYKCQYISFGNIADRCLLGQMLLGKDNEFHPIIHAGVANHCTDACFFNFANILAGALGYSTITGKHTVNVTTSKQYSINQIDQIKDGYVTILTYSTSLPNMTITKATSGDEISIQIISLSDVLWINTPSTMPTYAVVFKMPDDDVNVEY